MPRWCLCLALAAAASPCFALQPPLHARRARTTTTLRAAATAADLPRTAVIGAGPAGLATAIVLAQRGYRVDVYDRLTAPPSPDDASVWEDASKFYLIGLGARGQKALKSIGAWEAVSEYCTAVVGRKDWSPGAAADEGVERIFVDRPYLTQVLARDRLAGVLNNIVSADPAVTVHYGVEVEGIEWRGEDDCVAALALRRAGAADVAAAAAARGAPADAAQAVAAAAEARSAPADAPAPAPALETLEYGLVVGADGTSRTVGNAMAAGDVASPPRRAGLLGKLPLVGRAAPFRVVRYPDDNERLYKTVPMQIPKGGDWRFDLNYSARTKDGRLNFDALPASPTGSYCGVLLLKKDDPLAAAGADPSALRALFDEALPQFSALLSDAALEAVAAKPSSRLPGFRYAGPRLHQGSSTIVLGDAAHTVKPYFGLGANSALEDVQALAAALDRGGGAPLRAFSAARGAEAEALVKISRGFDRPGLLGFATFILPLILDGVFNGLAPRVFEKNTIALLQNENYTFERVGSRKRRDRALQAALVAAGGFGAAAAVGRAAPVLLRRPALGVLGAAAAAAAALGSSGFLKRGLAPADVLSMLKAKITNNETFLMKSRMKQKGYGEKPEETTGTKPPVFGFQEARRMVRKMNMDSRAEFEEYDCPGVYVKGRCCCC